LSLAVMVLSFLMSESPVEAPPSTVDLNTMMVLTDLAGKIAKTNTLIEVFTNKIQREMELMESRLNKRIDDVAYNIMGPKKFEEQQQQRRKAEESRRRVQQMFSKLK